ncbi:MAG: AAA family ATPase [Thermoproteota archaeon]|nr:AAA family ATPase [Thermoproteota archaeon]
MSLRVRGDSAENEEVIAVQRDGTKVTIQMTKEKSLSKSPLREMYDIDYEKYNLHPNYEFPKKVKALIPEGTPYFIDSGHNYVKRIIRALYYFKQCALIGPSGTGKTHIAYLVAEVTGLPMYEVNCGLQTSSYDLIGRYIGLGKENWIDGPLVSWLRNGGLMYLDEANMMKQDVATRLNPVLDTRGHMVITEKDSEIVQRQKYGYLIITMNPYSAEFAGTKPLNAAFRRRMSVWIDFDYPSVGERIVPEEADLIAKKGVDTDMAYRVLRVGAEMRRQYKAGDLPYGPSLGDLMHWAVLISDGLNPLDAAEETIIMLTSDNPEVQADVRRVVKSVFEKT